MRNLCSSSGQCSPLETKSITIQGTKEKRIRESFMNEKLPLLFWSEFSIRNGEFHYQVRKRRKGTESVMDEKFALLFWSEFSIGNGEFHYQVWKRRREQCPSWMRNLHSSSRQSPPLGTESSTIRYKREEQSLSWMRSLHFSSSESTPLRTVSFNTRYWKEEKEQSQKCIRSLHSSSGQSSPLGTESFIIRYVREEKNRVHHEWEVCAPLLVRVLYHKWKVPLSGTKEKRRTVSVMDEKFALLFWSEFSTGNG